MNDQQNSFDDFYDVTPEEFEESYENELELREYLKNEQED